MHDLQTVLVFLVNSHIGPCLCLQLPYLAALCMWLALNADLVDFHKLHIACYWGLTLNYLSARLLLCLFKNCVKQEAYDLCAQRLCHILCVCIRMGMLATQIGIEL